MTPRRIGMILTMPLPQMLQATMMAMATMATHQLLEQLLMAEEDRFRPMAMMMGPVTIGGKKRMTLLAPKALNSGREDDIHQARAQ